MYQKFSGKENSIVKVARPNGIIEEYDYVSLIEVEHGTLHIARDKGRSFYLAQGTWLGVEM